MESIHFMFAYTGEGGESGRCFSQQDVLLYVRSWEGREEVEEKGGGGGGNFWNEGIGKEDYDFNSY